MGNKITNVLKWPFKVDNRGVFDLSFKAGFFLFLFLLISGIILYKSITYYKFTYYDYIDAEQAVNDYFVQGNVSIEKFDYEGFLMKSGAVNLHFHFIKEKPQIVTYIEDSPPNNEDIVKRANTLFNEIGIGSAEYNNGVLIYLAADTMSFKIEVGYGLEDVITDSTAGRILDNAIYNAGGKDNISESNISSVLLSIFTDTAKITAKKYNIDISKDLNAFSWNMIKYREAQDKKALYLKILIISLSLFIILLMLSKRYVISMLIGPIIIIVTVLLFSGYSAAAIVVFFIYPLKSINRLNLDDKEYEAFMKSKKSDDINEEEKREVGEVHENLLSLMIIPPKNRSYFKNMPYQFVIFYCTLFLVLFFVVVELFMAVDYKSITLLSHFETPYETILHSDYIKDILKLAGAIFIIIVTFILVIKFKSFRTIFLYNFILYILILSIILKGIFLGILLVVMIIYALYLRHIGVIGCSSGSGGRSGGIGGGSFRSGGRSSGGSRSFGGGGRSGGGGAFRR